MRAFQQVFAAAHRVGFFLKPQTPSVTPPAIGYPFIPALAVGKGCNEVERSINPGSIPPRKNVVVGHPEYHITGGGEQGGKKTEGRGILGGKS
jgi:hypothetical protein